MKKVVILHGTQGSPEGNWFRWLETELLGRGFEVWLPTLPFAEQPSARQWLDYVHQNCPFELDGDTVLIGHSSGGVLALLLAQENKMKLNAVVAVSVFHDNSLKWSANDHLFDVPFDWEKIPEGVQNRQPGQSDEAAIRQGEASVNTWDDKPNILCIHSDDDPYVPLEQARYVAENIRAELLVVPGQGHFNLEKSDAYCDFPALLNILDDRHML